MMSDNNVLPSARAKAFLAGLFFIGSIFLQVSAEKKFKFNNTPLFSKEFSEIARYSDFWLIFFGHRRIAADIVFIQMLQYYGSIHYDELIKDGKVSWGHGLGTGRVRYDKLFTYALRCSRLDRNFEFGVTFPAAALAWVQKRDDEAIYLLTDALKFRPDFYQAGLYLSAIAARKNKGVLATIKYLEKTLVYPDCPDMIKNILAAIYEKRGDYRNAVRVWGMNFNSRNPYYRKTARRKIEEHYKKINNR